MNLPRIIQTVATPAARRIPWDELSGAYRYAKGKSKVIPSETSSGQLGMFPATYGKARQPMRSFSGGISPKGGVPNPALRVPPPFKASRHAGAGDARAQVTGLARKEELAMKRKKADAEQAIGQTGKVLAADRAGQMTNREFAFQMRNLMRRRKRV